MLGVVAYIDANDIPGINDWNMKATAEPVFCTGHVEFAGQPVGLIVAESQEIAVEAAKLVKISYENEQAVIADIQEAIKVPEHVTQASDPVTFGNVEAGFASSETIISGSYSMPGQYHFQMETQVCIAKPTDDGIDIESATQYITHCKAGVAQVLNIPVHR